MRDWAEALVALLNTTPVVDGQATDTLDAAWLRSRGLAALRVADARRLRGDLQQVVTGTVGPAVLGGYLADVRQTPALADGAIRWELHADPAARLVLAWGELARTLPGRLRPCGNDECRLFLLDRTRAGTARWCSMASCGNRMKARRHYRRDHPGRRDPGAPVAT